MIITIGATKLSKKEWKTVTNILFVYPLTIILMIIKWVVSGDKWLINTRSNSNNAKNKKNNDYVNKNEPILQDRKVIWICIFSLIIIAIIVSSLATYNNSKQSESDEDKYHQFEFDEVDGGYLMRESYKFMNPKYEGQLVIPETYKNKPIVEIDSINDTFGRGITKIIGSKNLISIKVAAFGSRDSYSMPNLTEVVFPADGKLRKIETHAFYWQNSLKTVILPSQFEHFEDGVFERCFALENLVIYNTVPPQIDGDIFNSDGNLMNDEKWHTKPNKKFIVYVPDDAVETYKNSIWGKYTIKGISEASFL